VIPFSKPTSVSTEWDTMREAISAGKLSGDGEYTRLATEKLAEITGQSRALLTGSCSHALDMAAMLLDLKPGDEVIMPSYTFVSTANAFVLQGAVPVFIDVRPETMNIDERLIEPAITDKTRAICVMHYGGVACAMDEIMEIAKRHEFPVVEDAAQAVDAYYRGRAGQQHIGTIGTFGTFSFHDTKNITSGGEGGALLVNDERYWERARIIREKGTNRSQFYEGIVDKYTWVDVGSSYLMAELNAAFLLPQLEAIDQITSHRRHVWKRYLESLQPLVISDRLELASVPEYAEPNGHLFYVKVSDTGTRSALIAYLREQAITAPFHYIPLHSSPAGRRFGRYHGADRYTSTDAARLIRLPMFHGITDDQVQRVIDNLMEFFRKRHG
jgi:dTDP-4-amino-4,6-dideoxygalactose transaminase